MPNAMPTAMPGRCHVMCYVRDGVCKAGGLSDPGTARRCRRWGIRNVQWLLGYSNLVRRPAQVPVAAVESLLRLAQFDWFMKLGSTLGTDCCGSQNPF